MSRNLPPQILDAIAADQIHTAHLFRATFTNRATGQDETYYATDNATTVIHQDTTYPALGTFLGYEGAEENAEMAIGTARLNLSGVESAYISAILSYAYINRELSISRVFFNTSTGQIIGDPEPVFTGPMDEPTVADDPDTGSTTITLTASNHFAAFDRTPGRHNNHEEQQAFFLGDMFFNGFGNIDQELVWGRA